jgi:Co/Zn/Cd efflux system component
MTCECGVERAAKTEDERKRLRVALWLNAAMFVIGMVAGVWARSTGLMADALDMLADASAYGLGLMAVSRGATFKVRAAWWSGSVLLVLGIGILVEVAAKAVVGTAPQACIMIAFSMLSLLVNVSVLRMLAPFRTGEAHLRATWLFTRADVIANIGVLLAGALILVTHIGMLDLVAGILIGAYVIKEAWEILSDTAARTTP